jgi:hypothetical protein
MRQLLRARRERRRARDGDAEGAAAAGDAHVAGEPASPLPPPPPPRARATQPQELRVDADFSLRRHHSASKVSPPEPAPCQRFGRALPCLAAADPPRRRCGIVRL